MPRVCRYLSFLLAAGCLGLFPWDMGRASGQGRSYAIQVGAYRGHERAEKRVCRLKSLGHASFYRHEAVKGKGLWYRVYLETFRSRGEAEREAAVLKDLGLVSRYTVRALHEAVGAGRPGKGQNRGEICLLHVSSFQVRAHAEKEVERLLGFDLRAVIVREKAGEKGWYRVLIGPFEHEKRAREAGSGLRDRGVIAYFKPMVMDSKALSSETVGAL